MALAHRGIVMSKHRWLSDDQVQKLNERHGWFKHGDAQSDVSRAFANDAIEAHERMRATAPELLAELEMLSNVVEGCGMTTMPEVECRLIFARAAIAKATGEA
ncbi:hypothetical protein CEE55_01650 [Stenotrophomonas pavanii]|uniref:Uncharacterized protein n=1 Tax=Stenotrophomonas pavanii TaxID=487698 RepID=A0A246L3E8_9GAMM|nr:hypothetical protein [Stenotrophomonas pavanii]OWR35528.1 hypothetical protein CEE55_01650 [Stenotrophomonas pavanii]